MKKVFLLFFLISMFSICRAQQVQLVVNDSIETYSNDNVFQEDFEVIFVSRDDDKEILDRGYFVNVRWTGGVSRVFVKTASLNDKAIKRMGRESQGVAKDLKHYFQRFCRTNEIVELRQF